ncbi:DUF2273 domain-containing protein [Olsenella profusa]|uniref:DUF2273 domain-containing protein n=1 Tax=Olsenella profusa TaxID=138595 RepID=A0ABS2F4Y1_9ACTN|nr:DUF2273 domain-containing protein [Olsenella profusa]MBM6775617.1 DUF2273 domain-containing protein [Olsenella profusa]
MADRDDRRPKVEVEQGEKNPAADASPAGEKNGAAGTTGTAGAAPRVETGPATADAGASLRGAGSCVRSWVSATFPGNENAFWGGVVGLVAALVLIAIGPWYAFVIAALILVGVAVGQLVDGDPKIINALRRLFSRGNQ